LRTLDGRYRSSSRRPSDRKPPTPAHPPPVSAGKTASHGRSHAFARCPCRCPSVAARSGSSVLAAGARFGWQRSRGLQIREFLLSLLRGLHRIGPAISVPDSFRLRAEVSESGHRRIRYGGTRRRSGQKAVDPWLRLPARPREPTRGSEPPCALCLPVP